MSYFYTKFWLWIHFIIVRMFMISYQNCFTPLVVKVVLTESDICY